VDFASSAFIHNLAKGRCLVSSKKDSELDQKPKTRFSRRGFLGGMGVGTGALSTGLLEREAEAAPATANVFGPAGVPITLNINGKPVKLTLEPRVTLLDALRNHLDMTGAKRVCDRGTCGACTVILNGKTVYACSVLAIDAQGKDIQTIEGLPQNNPISTAFWNNDAQQCGYCTPGFVMATKGFLDEHPNPTPDDLKHGLGGNLCRCGTYMGVRQAVLEAAKNMKGAKNG
jgi:xanthine dehydrogenase YagT iron-sulfur-binding subunit